MPAATESLTTEIRITVAGRPVSPVQVALAQLGPVARAELLARKISTIDAAGVVAVMALGEAIERGLDIASRFGWAVTESYDDDNHHGGATRTKGKWKSIGSADAWTIDRVANWNRYRMIDLANAIRIGLAPTLPAGIVAHEVSTATIDGKYLVSIYVGPKGGRMIGGAHISEDADGLLDIEIKIPGAIGHKVLEIWESID